MELMTCISVNIPKALHSGYWGKAIRYRTAIAYFYNSGAYKLQAKGHEGLFRNIWVKELNLKNATTDVKF